MITIVRGGNHDQASQRLRDGFDSGDADLLAIYDALSAEHLTVYSGTSWHGAPNNTLLLTSQDERGLQV